MPTRIHINQHKIRSNKKHGTNEPVITVKRGKTNTYCHGVEIHGPSRVLYQPDCPLSCGARVWIETDSPVALDTGCSMKRKESKRESKTATESPV
jgi:hypothetical protein